MEDDEEELADSPVSNWLQRQLGRQRAANFWRIDFGGQPHGDRGLKALSKCLPEGLLALDLELPTASAPTDAGLRAVAAKLRGCPSLSRFALCCAMCDGITDQSVVVLLAAMQLQKRLQELSLDFAVCAQLTDSSVDSIGVFLQAKGAAEERPVGSQAQVSAVRSAAPRHSPDASPQDASPSDASFLRFDLNLHGCKQITDSSLATLGDGLAALNSLRVLTMSLSDVGENVTAQGFRSVFAGLTNIATLEHVDINCSMCPELLESALINLCQALTLKDKLKYLVLNFAGCASFTSGGLSSFNEVFRHAKALESVTLNFTKCERITNKGIEELCTYLKGHQFLKRLSLHVGCTKVTQDCVPLLNDMMKHLEHFRLCVAVRLPMTAGVTVAFRY